jgi:hypothetical protein
MRFEAFFERGLRLVSEIAARRRADDDFALLLSRSDEALPFRAGIRAHCALAQNREQNHGEKNRVSSNHGASLIRQRALVIPSPADDSRVRIQFPPSLG